MLVGVSEYAAPNLHLRFAHRDVEELWALLQTDRCGGFIPERARVLVNEQATTAAITRALRSFLQDASEDDVVLIYFSGHGAPDPKRRDVVYFLTHDTNPADIAGTALPMREIMQSLGENLRAKRVIMMMDTCHSAAVEGGRGMAAGDPAVLEQYLANLQSSDEGFAILTSSEANEQSREGTRWGGGHGLFTHLVLEGLRGKADTNQNGIVTLGELFDHVVEQTRALGGPGAQHPRVGHRPFDRSFVVAITGGADARDRLDLGRALLEMAIQYNDRRRFESAARHLAEADDLAQHEGGLPEARMRAGIARLGAGDTEGACQDLRRALLASRRADEPGRRGCADAGYYLGIALAIHGAPAEAADAFGAFAREHPTSARAQLAASLRRLLVRQAAPPGLRQGRLRALLIGVEDYPGMPGGHLAGPATDVRLLRELLAAHRIGFADEIVCLVNEDATHERVVHELAHLRTSDPEDSVVVSFSGHAGTDGQDQACDAYLLLSDARLPSGGVMAGQLGAVELDRALTAIPAHHKLVVLDTLAHPMFVELAERASCTYSVLLATPPGKAANQHRFEAGGEIRTAGLLTYALVQTLSVLSIGASWSEILPRLVADVTSRQADQAPMLIGSDVGSFLAGVADPIPLLEMSLFGDRRARSGHQLESWYAAVNRQLAQLQLGPFPDLHLAFGRALAEARSPRAAERALERAREDSLRGLVTRDGKQVWTTDPVVDPAVAWCRTWVALQQRAYDRAIAAFHDLSATLEAPDRPRWRDDFEVLVAGLRGRRPRALIVGIDRYRGPDVQILNDAVSDAESVRQVLVRRCGLAAEDITFLADERATTAAIVGAFDTLTAAAQTSPALFYFSGNGSHDEQGAPTILGADARKEAVFDISLEQLARSAGAANLACVFDTDGHDVNATRFVPRDLRAGGAVRALRVAEHDSERHLDLVEDEDGVGFGDRVGQRGAPAAGAGQLVGRVTISARPGHRITRPLVDRLHQVDPASISWATWSTPVTSPREAELLGDACHELVFHDATATARAEAFLQDQRRAPWIAATIVLGAMIEDARLNPRDWLVDLGTTYALLGDLARAANTLMRAIAASPDSQHPEASYHLGRVLLEAGKDLSRAQSELEAAADACPDDPAIQYYLGVAIRTFFEKESLEKARTAWRKYRDAGAPLGHLDDVEAFLGSATPRRLAQAAC